MTDKDEFNSLTKDEIITLIDEAREDMEQSGECYMDDTDVIARAVAKYREMKQIRELIEKSHEERSNENDQ